MAKRRKNGAADAEAEATTEQQPVTQTGAEKIALETMRGDIRDALLTEFKSRPKAWQQMNEQEQDSIIFRLNHIAQGLVDRAVYVVAHQGAPYLAGEVNKFTVKDGLKIEFGSAGLAENIIKLAEHSGAAVLVLIEPRKYQGQRADAKPDVVGDLKMPRERQDEAQLAQVGKGAGEPVDAPADKPHVDTSAAPFHAPADPGPMPEGIRRPNELDMPAKPAMPA